MGRESSAGERPGRAGFTLVELLVVIMIIAMLVGLLLPAVQRSREAARFVACGNNLKQIGLAILDFESAQGALPAGYSYYTDNSGASWGWAVFILPYLEEADLYDQLSPQTRRLVGLSTSEKTLLQTPLAVYRCPTDTSPDTNTLVRPGATSPVDFGSPAFLRYPATSNYVGSCGRENSAYPSLDTDTGGIFFGIKHQVVTGNTVSGIPVGVKFRHIPDGTSKVLAVGERGGLPEVAAVWAGVGNTNGYDSWKTARTLGRPDMLINMDWGALGSTGNIGKGFWSDHEGGMQGVYVDGHVAFVSENLNSTELTYLTNRKDGRDYVVP